VCECVRVCVCVCVCVCVRVCVCACAGDQAEEGLCPGARIELLLLLCRMGATFFVQPLDLVKNRMQLSGQGGRSKEYRTSFHALSNILRAEGVGGIYTG